MHGSVTTPASCCVIAQRFDFPLTDSSSHYGDDMTATRYSSAGPTGRRRNAVVRIVDGPVQSQQQQLLGGSQIDQCQPVNTVINIDIGSVKALRAVALAAHNLSASASWRIKLGIGGAQQHLRQWQSGGVGDGFRYKGFAGKTSSGGRGYTAATIQGSCIWPAGGCRTGTAHVTRASKSVTAATRQGFVQSAGCLSAAGSSLSWVAATANFRNGG